MRRVITVLFGGCPLRGAPPKSTVITLRNFSYKGKRYIMVPETISTTILVFPLLNRTQLLCAVQWRHKTAITIST